MGGIKAAADSAPVCVQVPESNAGLSDERTPARGRWTSGKGEERDEKENGREWERNEKRRNNREGGGKGKERAW